MSKNRNVTEPKTTEAEWDEQFDKITGELSEETLGNGESVFTVEGFDKWMDAIKKMPDFPDD